MLNKKNINKIKRQLRRVAYTITTEPVVYLCTVCVAIVEGILLFRLLDQTLTISMVFAIHLSIVTFLIGFSLLYWWQDKDSTLPILLTLMTGILGVVGAVGTSLTMLVVKILSRHTTPILDWFDSLIPPVEVRNSEVLADRIHADREDFSSKRGVVSFLDVIQLGTREQKQRALAEMARNFCPSYSKILKRSLTDLSNAIRVQAATVIAKIQDVYIEKLFRLLQKQEDNLHDPQVVLSLAKHYDNYAFSGILDPVEEEDNRQQALLMYRAYLRNVPDDVEVLVAVGRLYLRNDDLEEAYQWFKGLLENRQIHDTQVIIWYLEVLFRMHKYEKLRELATQFSSQLLNEKYCDLYVKDVLTLWVR